MINYGISIFNRTFWDLWIQKLLRNIASVKYQWLLYMAIPTFWAMFTGHWYHPKDAAPVFVPMLNHTIGYTFMGGGFITLATSRIIARTQLTDDESVSTSAADSTISVDGVKVLDTDR